jgi:hypothetical protein
VFVNVVYHNKTPQYNDEVKIRLPALLNSSNYHLLFTFYHISCQNTKDQLDTIIGYSWLPLQQQFQYETTVYFTNQPATSSTGLGTTQLGQFNSIVCDPMVNLSSSSSSNGNGPLIGQATSGSSALGQTNKVSSTVNSNRVNMIKSGIYSLPISFEKLPQGTYLIRIF